MLVLIIQQIEKTKGLIALIKKNNFFICAVIFLMISAMGSNQNCALCLYCPVDKADECCSSSNTPDCSHELFNIACNHSKDLGCSCFDCIIASFKLKNVHGVRYLNELNQPSLLQVPHFVEPVLLHPVRESFLITKQHYTNAPLYILNRVLTI